MELLKQIKSKTILKNIFSFINNDDIKMNLFKYSHYFQKIFELDLYDYQDHYFEKSKFLHLFFLSFEYVKNYVDIKKVDKNYLKNALGFYLENNFPGNIQESDINKYIIEYFKRYAKKLEKEENIEQKSYYLKLSAILLDIYSPFFDLLSKSESFSQLFSINIPIDFIQENHLKNDYISTFDKLNKSNANYSSIYIQFENAEDLELLDEFKIKFNQIKKLEYNIMDSDNRDDINNYKIFVNKLFSFFPNENNLIYLRLYLNEEQIRIEKSIMENLNKFKLLEYLKIERFIIEEEPLIIKLYNLKELIIANCENIGFAEDSLLNIKRLEILNSIIIEMKSLLKLPEAREISLADDDYADFTLIFDFSSFKNIKKLVCKIYEFAKIDSNCPLESAILFPSVNNSKDIERQMFEKIISMKELKQLTFELNFLEEILKIHGDNSSVESLSMGLGDLKENNMLNNLIEKFPNVSYLSLNAQNYNFISDNSYLKINENSKSKIKIMDLTIHNNNHIILDSSPYEELTRIQFDIKDEIINIKEAFPLFNEKCNVIFKSMTSFKFVCNTINLDVLNNIFHNLENMPNLKYFTLKCISKEIKEEIYKKYINKILEMNLKKIELIIIRESWEKEDVYYSIDELKEINSDIKLNNLKKIKIHKLNDELSLSQFLNHCSVNFFE
jgi:hypothetical protein